MTTWYENKDRFRSWFGDELIYNYGHVEFHIDKDKRDKLVTQFLEQAGHILTYDEYESFADFVIINSKTFFDNIVSKPMRDATEGMRLSKAFKFFISDKETLTTVQQLASSYIQLDKIKGDLCLSVHPLDYLSLSENTYNWRSCHALDGDYRAGNISYMCDRSTIVCYIKGDEEKELPHFPPEIKWNSKKWRMLIFFDEDFDYCFLGRQYPYDLSEAIGTIYNNVLPLGYRPFTQYRVGEIPDIDVTFAHDQIVLYTNDGYKFFPINEVIEDCYNPLHYNDLLYSSYYKPYYTSRIRYDAYKTKPPKIKVGHNIKCLCCGQDSIECGEGLMTCTKCTLDNELGLPDGFVYCSCCGDAVDSIDAFTLYNGDVICENCLSTGDFVACANCGEIFPIDELTYDEKRCEYYCENCYDVAHEPRE